MPVAQEIWKQIKGQQQEGQREVDYYKAKSLPLVLKVLLQIPTRTVPGCYIGLR